MKKLLLAFALFVLEIQTEAQPTKVLLGTNYSFTDVKSLPDGSQLCTSSAAPFVITVDACQDTFNFQGIPEQLNHLVQIGSNWYGYSNTVMYVLDITNHTGTLAPGISLSSVSLGKPLKINDVKENTSKSILIIVGDFDQNNGSPVGRVITYDGTNVISIGGFSSIENPTLIAVKSNSVFSVRYGDTTLVMEPTTVPTYFVRDKFRTYDMNTGIWTEETYVGDWDNVMNAFQSSNIVDVSSIVYYNNKLTIHAKQCSGYPFTPSEAVVQIDPVTKSVVGIGGIHSIDPTTVKMSVRNGNLYIFGNIDNVQDVGGNPHVSYDELLSYWNGQHWYSGSPQSNYFGQNISAIDIDPKGNVVTAGGTIWVKLGQMLGSLFTWGDSLPTQKCGSSSGITDIQKSEISLYPNPTTDNVSIAGLPIGENLDVINVLGEKILTTKTTESVTTLSVQHFPPGMYFLRAKNFSKSFVKQ